MTSRFGRLGTLALLAAVPLTVLGVFFVLPVTGMLARGLWVDGSFDPAGVADVLTRPRVQRVLWFTCGPPWRARCCRSRSASPRRTRSTGSGSPAVGWPAECYWSRSCCPPWWSASPSASCSATAVPWGSWDSTRSPVAIIAGLVFFNVAVVIRVVGTTWETLDPRPADAAATLGATPLQVFRTVTWPALRPAVVSAASVVFLFCATAFGIVLTLGGLRYSTVETEIYLLTTNLLDLRAAAALSLVQLVVVVALLLSAQRLRRGPRPHLRSRCRPEAADRTWPTFRPRGNGGAARPGAGAARHAGCRLAAQPWRLGLWQLRRPGRRQVE